MLRGLENAGAMSNIFPLSVVPNFSSFHMAICLITELKECRMSCDFKLHAWAPPEVKYLLVCITHFLPLHSQETENKQAQGSGSWYSSLHRYQLQTVNTHLLMRKTDSGEGRCGEWRRIQNYLLCRIQSSVEPSVVSRTATRAQVYPLSRLLS